ncbi:MAG TPA: nuclear transport factor 2 family protein [Candidatus Nitrosotalea sp.]|nr:nuclear transport factor 2 family protein [Candidatus Nitrosotalea sp.]
MKISRMILAAALSLAAFGFAAPLAAAPDPGVMAAVNQFVDAFNRGDVRSAASACAPAASIIDDFPPHQWQGANACAKWFAAYNAMAKKSGITDGIVTLGHPWHVDVTGDLAYVVAPTTFTYKVHGKPVSLNGSVFTLVLSKLDSAWRITGWAWADH